MIDLLGEAQVLIFIHLSQSHWVKKMQVKWAEFVSPRSSWRRKYRNKSSDKVYFLFLWQRAESLKQTIVEVFLILSDFHCVLMQIQFLLFGAQN